MLRPHQEVGSASALDGHVRASEKPSDSAHNHVLSGGKQADVTLQGLLLLVSKFTENVEWVCEVFVRVEGGHTEEGVSNAAGVRVALRHRKHPQL